jgi:multiple sugar transport system permease protein
VEPAQDARGWFAEAVGGLPMKKKSEESRALLLLVGPSVGILAALNVFPIFYAIYISLYNWSLAKPGPPRFLGLFNYEDLLDDDRFINSIQVSITFTVLAVLFEFILGLLLAFVFNSRGRGMVALRKLAILPVLVTPLIGGLVWRYMLNQDYGTITWFAYALGLGRPPFLTDDWMAMFSLVVADVWQWTPLVMLVIFAALQSVPEYIYEAARMDGLSRMQILWRVTLPLLRPAIVVILILRAIDAFRNLELVYMMTRGGPGGATETLPWYLYTTGFVDQDLGSASAMAVVMIVFITIVSQLVIRHLRYRER